VLLNAAIMGAAAVTLASSCALGDVFRKPHSLHHGIGRANAFHGSYAAMVLLAAAILFIPGAALGTITTAVQALTGVLLPSATVFLLLLCNDKAVLGAWTNPGWLNVIASAIVGVLVALSADRTGPRSTFFGTWSIQHVRSGRASTATVGADRSGGPMPGDVRSVIFGRRCGRVVRRRGSRQGSGSGLVR